MLRYVSFLSCYISLLLIPPLIFLNISSIEEFYTDITTKKIDSHQLIVKDLLNEKKVCLDQSSGIGVEMSYEDLIMMDCPRKKTVVKVALKMNSPE